MVLAWRQFLADVPDIESKAFYQSLFFEAEKLINFLSINYGLTETPPELFIEWHVDENAGVIFNQIIIRTGLLEFLKLNDMSLSSKHRTSNSPQITFLWIVAHEFMHYGQNHNKVKRDKKAHLAKDYSLVVEYDADGLATAALYRFLMSQKKQKPIDVKLNIIASLYYPIRTRMVSRLEFTTETKSLHPPWKLRLYCCLTKLAWTDNYEVVNEIAKHTLLAEVEKKLLHEELLNLETNFLIMAGKVNSDYLDYLNNNAMKDFEAMLDDWDEIKLDIKDASRLSTNVYS